MDKKVMDTLHAMLCGEIEDIAKKGTLSHETLDVLKDLVETEKNLEKIKKYKKEEESEWEDKGYSQRKYYIDADYQPGNSYARGGRAMYDMGNSYGYPMGRGYDGGRSYMDGNSYMYDPRYDMPMYSMARGYSRTSKAEMVEELQKMMGEASDETVKKAIQEAINKMNK